MAAAELVCAYHPGARAELECKPCHTLLCRACAKLLRDERTYECLRCGALLLPISLGARPVAAIGGPVSDAARRADVGQPLIERLPKALAYLGRPSVLMTLGGLAVLRWLSSFTGLAVGLVVAGVTAALFFHIVETTANDATDLDPPDFSDVWAHVVSPFFRMLATVLPLFIAWVLADFSIFEAMAARPGEWLAHMGPATIIFVLWIALWPLLVLVAAISRSVVSTYDPRVWIASLRQMKGDYVVAALAYYAVLLVEYFVLTPVVWKLAFSMHIPFVSEVIAQLVVLLPMALRARILGEAARPYID